MLALIQHVYSPWEWLDHLTLAITLAGLAWLAAAIPTALVVGPLLRRNRHDIERRTAR